VFCECFAAFPQNTQKRPEKHRKTLENKKNSQYARVLRAFFKSQKFRLYCTKHFSQNIRKTPQNTHRKTPQNSHKTRFMKLRRKTPQTQNAQDCHINGRNTAAIRIE